MRHFVCKRIFSKPVSYIRIIISIKSMTKEAFKGGPSDLGMKSLKKVLKNHTYTPKAF